jgi:hypothetical protein
MFEVCRFRMSALKIQRQKLGKDSEDTLRSSGLARAQELGCAARAASEKSLDPDSNYRFDEQVF